MRTCKYRTFISYNPPPPPFAPHLPKDCGEYAMAQTHVRAHMRMRVLVLATPTRAPVWARTCAAYPDA